MSKKRVNFDPRTKLLLVLFANFLLLAHVRFKIELIGVSVFFVLFLLIGAWRKAVIYFSVFLAAVYLDYFIAEQEYQNYWSVLGIFAVGIRRFLPAFMAGSISFSTTKASEWVVAMKRLRLPTEIVVPMTVLFRFFPTVIEDYKHIRNAMKLRGIAVTNLSVVKKPFKFLENVLVPLLMSASNTAVDLSASSLSRGISSPGKHSSYVKIGFHIQDILLVFVIILILYLNWGSEFL